MTRKPRPNRYNAVSAAPTLIILFAAIGFGLVPLFAKHLQALGVSSPAIALYRFCFSALATAPFLPYARAKRGQALVVVASGVFVGLGWIGYLEAVQNVTVAAAGVVYMSYPLFALAFAWLFAGQRPGGRALAAGLLVLSAALLLLDPDQLSTSGVHALLWSLPAPMSFGLVVVVLSCLVSRLDGLERLACVMLGASLGLAPLAAAGTGAPARAQTADEGFTFGPPEDTVAVPDAAPQNRDPRAEAAERYAACLELARSEPDKAIERARTWQDTGGGDPARHCEAIAHMTRGDYHRAGRMLEDLARTMPKDVGAQPRVNALSQASRAWLLGERPARAEAAATQALEMQPDDVELLLDRAHARFQAGAYWETIDDLNRAIELACGGRQVLDRHLCRIHRFSLPDRRESGRLRSRRNRHGGGPCRPAAGE